MIKLTFITSG